jgi:hypothetical protein
MENIVHSKMSGGTLSGIVAPRKRKSDEVCSYEFYSFAQKKVSTNKHAGLYKRSRSVVSLNEQLSLCDTKRNELQSFSNHVHQPFKKVKGDVLKDRTNTPKELINKYQENAHQLLEPSVCTEEMCFAHCNTTEPILSSSSHCIQECRAVLTQEHRVTELSEDVCTSGMKHSATAKKSACYDDSDSCNAGYYVEATKCVDANSGASFLCTQATVHSEPMPVLEASVSGNVMEDQQCETDMQTRHCYRRAHDVLEPPVYPRHLTYGKNLTRNQYQNCIESTRSEVCLNVEDVLSPGDYLLEPQLRTRSSCGLKKLIQDLSSYPTVVLCRVDENVKQEPHES